jgi:hypothetical protein
MLIVTFSQATHPKHYSALKIKPETWVISPKQIKDKRLIAAMSTPKPNKPVKARVKKGRLPAVVKEYSFLRDM